MTDPDNPVDLPDPWDIATGRTRRRRRARDETDEQRAERVADRAARDPRGISGWGREG